jgi:pimeloyl-ACP methyl ester carboxylesterase
MEAADIQLLIVPGLGEDERMSYPQLALPFRLLRPNYVEPVAGEDLASYCSHFAETLSPQIDPRYPLYLMGASLGAAMVQELSHYLTTSGIILVSGYRTSAELSPFLRWLGRTVIPRLPLWVLTFGELFTVAVVSYLTNAPRHDNRMCGRMYREFPKTWFREFARMGSSWKGCRVTAPVLRIHGDRDPVFPYVGQSDINLLIEGDRHMSALSHKELVNETIIRWMLDLENKGK